MAYQGSTAASTLANPPVLVTQGIARATSGARITPRAWVYVSTHISSDVSAANFFTDGLELGMKVNDQLLHYTSTGGIITSHTVLVVGSTTTDIGVGTTIGLAS